MFGRAIVLGIALLTCSIAEAQDASHWGVVVTLSPAWSVPSAVGKNLGGTIDLKGSDFAIGIAHGRERSGDWGVSFVRKQVKDGSRVEDIESVCGFANGCFVSGDSRRYTATTMTGVEVHKYISFVTIADRAQIGMNFAGGVASVSGTQEKHLFDADTFGFDRTGNAFGRQLETVTLEPADFGVSTFPLLKIQLAAAALVTPALKIRVAGGLNVPGTELFSITGIYLFGAR